MTNSLFDKLRILLGEYYSLKKHGKSVKTLEVAKIEPLSDTEDFTILQTSDETIFYCSPTRVYIKLNDNEVDAILPKERIVGFEIHEKTLFFRTIGKIYKTTITERQLKVTYDEIWYDCGLASQVRNGRNFFHRVWEDPKNNEGIMVDISARELNGLEVKGIHRERLVCFSMKPPLLYNETPSIPSLRKILGKIFVIETYWTTAHIYVQDVSPLVYYSCFDKNIYVANVDTMDELQPLQIRGIEHVCKIVRVHNGKITALCKNGNEDYLVTAQLPEHLFLGELASEDNEEAEDDKPDSSDHNLFDSVDNEFEQLTETILAKIFLFFPKCADKHALKKMVAHNVENFHEKILRAVKDYQIEQVKVKVKNMQDRQKHLLTLQEMHQQKFDDERSFCHLVHKISLLFNEVDNMEQNFNENRRSSEEEKFELQGLIRDLQEKNTSLTQQNNSIQAVNAELSENINQISTRLENIEHLNGTLFNENEQLKQTNILLEQLTEKSKIEALLSVRPFLNFYEKINLTKPYLCNQLKNGNIVYFYDQMPFELFTLSNGNRINVDLSFLEEVSELSFRGQDENFVHYSALCKKKIKFYKANIDDGHKCQLINEMNKFDIIQFSSQPLYYVEQRGKQWSVYKNHEKYTEMDGEKYDLSMVKSLIFSKYQHHYHRGIIYLFRNNSSACVEKVNEKVIIVEGPLIDSSENSFYIPSHSEFIYILNSKLNIIIILNTVNLKVSQQIYEAPANTRNHKIVGIYDGILTMSFDGSNGRFLSTAKMF